MNQSLQNSEKRLTHSFVFWAFLFLIFFEALFLGTRYFIEKKNSEEKFIEWTEQLLGRNIENSRGRWPSFFGIATLKTTLSGDIIFSQNNFSGITNISQILSETEIKNLQKNPFIYHEELLIRRYENNGTVVYFFSRELDISGEFYRDIVRFLLIDLVLLIPLYFLLRLHIRRILKPVQENMETMSHFVHDAGHELKTPLAIISGNLQIMRDSDDIEFMLIEENLETVNRMNESIQWLLELADLRLPNKEKKTNLTEIINNEIANANNFQNVTFDQQITEKFCVHASKKHLSIIMRNLIENAIKYNKEGGKVTISRTGNNISVSDTGIGMTSEETERVFDRFFRANQWSGITGTWIGLTLVDQIIKLYDWKIDIKSKPEIGTTFTVYFK